MALADASVRGKLGFGWPVVAVTSFSKSQLKCGGFAFGSVVNASLTVPVTGVDAIGGNARSPVICTLRGDATGRSAARRGQGSAAARKQLLRRWPWLRNGPAHGQNRYALDPVNPLKTRCARPSRSISFCARKAHVPPL